MLSILIPVFNVDVRSLVNALATQAQQLSLVYEIVIEDDASTDAQTRENNASLSQRPDVTLIQNECNQGRSVVRNHLAQIAQYPYLLMMDCDASVARTDYLSQYVQYVCSHNNLPFVVLGGVAYREQMPDVSFRLRWKYGVTREQKSAAMRNLHPYRAFTPFNMLITKSVFELCRFDESLTTYGFEDTLFGEHLQALNVPVEHLDNPLFHDGLDSNETFLLKIQSSIDNLVRLKQENRLPESFVRNSKLLTTYDNLQHWHLVGFVKVVLSCLIKPIRWTALHCCSVRALDLFKLQVLLDRLPSSKRE